MQYTVKYKKFHGAKQTEELVVDLSGCVTERSLIPITTTDGKPLMLEVNWVIHYDGGAVELDCHKHTPVGCESF